MQSRRLGLLVSIVLTFAACGGSGSSPPDDAAPTAIDAAADPDGGIDAATALDAGVDAPVDGGSPGGYVRQPPVPIPPAPPPADLSHLPTDDQGRPIVLDGRELYLVPRPPDALTALSACTGMIVRCVDPSVRGHNLDACVISPPRCATAQPWTEAAPCCATACVDRYEQLRTDGTPPLTAFRQAFYGRPACAPGAEALLGGAP